MSGHSYRLQTPRPRPPPSPLTFDTTSYRSSVLNSHRDSKSFLNDYSSAFTSPPTSPKLSGSISLPSSPSRANHGRPTPPPGGRPRSQTPIAPADLEKFAEQCRAWYYNQDEAAGHAMTKTMESVLPYHRATYSRVQSSIRAAYHRSISARRHAEYQAHLTATQPGGSLLPQLRANPRGKEAQKERCERMAHFLSNWGDGDIPGTRPFFEALWAILRLQVIPESLGGAGRNRIEWELDDAVLKESAGREFMLEAVDILKGVLAFEEQPSSQYFSTVSERSKPSKPAIESYPQSQSVQIAQPSSTPLHTPLNRARAPSDPFLDKPALLRSITIPSANSPSKPTTLAKEPSSPISPSNFDITVPSQFESIDDDDIEGEYLRVWTSPDLTNPEIFQLLDLFPAFVSRRTLPRFPAVNAARPRDIEEGEDSETDKPRVRFGTGSIWVSLKQRSDGWEGSWWTRWLLWWKRLFCC